jgi:hypothetical protein
MITFVQEQHATGISSSGSMTLTLTAGNYVHLVVASATGDQPSSVTDNHGGSFTASFYRSADETNLYITTYKIPNVTGGSTTYTVNFSTAGQYSIAGLEYSGLDPSLGTGDLANQFDHGASATTSDSGTLFLLSQPYLAVAWVASTGSINFTNTGSFTQRVNIGTSGSFSLQVCDFVGTATGTKSNTWSMDGTADWEGTIGAWKQAPAPSINKKSTMAIGAV